MIFINYIMIMNFAENKSKIKNPVFIWFLILTFMTFLMILIGGLTRLTDSGLSMVDWKPILGILPPLTEKDWLNNFQAYQNSPEFQIVNHNMNMTEFKYIYWWEWFHRFFARFLGVMFMIPMIFFIVKKKISINLFKSLLILFSFGLFQAVVGWWMVKSGLNENPYVSPYRLAFHLTNAIIIISILFWLTLNSYDNFSIKLFPSSNIEILIFFNFLLLIITIISGAFMAGSSAGQSYNTYPFMNGKIFPNDYFLKDNIIRNFFENTVAINFNHRWFATLCFINIIILTIYLKLIIKIKKQNFQILLILVFVTMQFLLGIMSLLSNVKIYLASMHQVNSILLLCSLIYIYYSIKKERII
jgi:heme a synthase